MSARGSFTEDANPHGICLTELNIPTLLAGALGISALLWLAVFVVL